MGTFNITSSSLNNNYTFVNDDLFVSGNYNLDMKNNNTLQNVQGQCYRKDAQGNQGEFVGNFNGYMRDGGIRYSMSEMSRRDSMLVWDAIDEIEANITGTNE